MLNGPPVDCARASPHSESAAVMMTAPVRSFAHRAIDPVMSCLQPSLNIPLSGGLVEVSNSLTRRFFVA
jgi:hypothetical protein